MSSWPQSFVGPVLSDWFDENGYVNPSEREFVRSILRALDSTYLRWWGDKQKD